MRVISLVPSWTETLLESGVNVVARTRYCIHPKERVEGIPIVGGTKKVDWKKIEDLKPDLLILDKEENPKSFLENIPKGASFWASHIESVNDLEGQLNELSHILKNKELGNLSLRWKKVLEKNPKRKKHEMNQKIQWIRLPSKEIQNVYYMIWKDPWMCAGRNTFIGSMLSLIGFQNVYTSDLEKYPQIDLEQIHQDDLVLFSSEPYPFMKEVENISNYPFSSAIVDGEAFSWFGLRSLRFLESLFS